MLVAVRSYNNHTKSEIFEDGNWREIQEIPVSDSQSSFSHCASIFNAGNFYYFGGYANNPISSIFRLNAASWTWSNVGQMNSPRHGHEVTLVDNKFMLIGGAGVKANEACTLDNDEFTCEEKSSTLYNYAWTPLLYVVNDNHGNC